MNLSSDPQLAISEVIRMCVDMGIKVSSESHNKGTWIYYTLGDNLVLENHNNNKFTHPGLLTTRWDVKNVNLELGWSNMYGRKKKISRYCLDSKGANRDEIRRILQIAKDYNGD